MQRTIKTYNFFLCLFLIGIVGILLSSCKKFLDKKSNTQLTTINRVEDLQALLDRPDQINTGRIPVYGEVSADNYFFNQLINTSGEKGDLAYTWQFFLENNTGSSALNDWGTCYLPVNISDICLDEIERLPKDPVNVAPWNNVKGSALFIRAFNFLNLCWIYTKVYDEATAASDPGIALQLGTDYHIPTVRATVAESYKQVIRDAKESLLYLPAIGIHPLRPSKAAAYGLLARAYLSMQLYDSAGVYADSCLQIRNELIDYNGDADIVSSLKSGIPPFRQYNKETIFYADMRSNGLNYMLAASNVDTSLYETYNTDDLRKTAYFTLRDTTYFQFKGSYAQNLNVFFGGIATDEMYLIRAECFARKEMVTEAMTYLNTLMIKRWNNTVPYPMITATDPANALNKILTERRKELLFRGLRWPDIKRLNKEGVGIVLKRIFKGHTYELLPNSDKYALPIPNDIIQLTGIAQNPGWQ